jgi:hypothetical protein
MSAIFVGHFCFALFLICIPQKCSVGSELVRYSSHDLFRFTTISVGQFGGLSLLSFKNTVLLKTAAGDVVRASNGAVCTHLSPLSFNDAVLLREQFGFVVRLATNWSALICRCCRSTMWLWRE